MKKTVLALLTLVFVVLTTMVLAEVSLSIPEGICSYQDNVLQATVPAEGSCDIEVLSDVTVMARLTDIRVETGTNSVTWNGLGFGDEVLLKANYTMRVCYTAQDGTKEEVSQVFTMGKPKQALLYALPATDTLWLEDGSAWSMQFETTRPGKIVMKLYAAEDPEEVAGTVVFTGMSGATRVKWNGCVNGKKLAAGNYHVVCYAQTNEAVKREFELAICEGKQAVLPVTETGGIMPSRYATDEEIWQLMTAPAVVFNTDEGAGNPIYEEPRAGSGVLGYVHGTSVAVEVIRLEEDGKWAYVGAWAAGRANYIEGYVPVSKLKTVLPAQDYGLLVDKREQTMTIFEHGKRIASLRVSTGKAQSMKSIKRETEAGSYLTVTRLTPFTTDGYRYEYVIRINQNNLIHSIGYNNVNKQHSFADESATLGEKASHGCIRVERDTEGGINAWWLWTHLRWNTRVIVMDDPQERAADYAAYGVDREDMPYTGTGTNSWD